jgi:hypothetical protein
MVGNRTKNRNAEHEKNGGFNGKKRVTLHFGKIVVFSRFLHPQYSFSSSESAFLADIVPIIASPSRKQWQDGENP